MPGQAHAWCSTVPMARLVHLRELAALVLLPRAQQRVTCPRRPRRHGHATRSSVDGRDGAKAPARVMRPILGAELHGSVSHHVPERHVVSVYATCTQPGAMYAEWGARACTLALAAMCAHARRDARRPASVAHVLLKAWVP